MVDICRPPLLWIEGRCYRRQADQGECTVEAGYTGEEGGEEGEGEEEELEHAIEELSGGRYRAVMQIASAFHGSIIGKGGESLKRLESDTRTKLTVPKKDQEGDVVIVGRDRRGVATAASRLDVLVASARARQPFTHFLSIPLNTAPVQEAFHTFQEEVLRSCPSARGLDPSVFQTSSLLHLTLGTMALLSERERGLARDLLEDCREEVFLPLLGEEPLTISLQGLEYMNDDPAEVDVLYCGVKDSSGKLQEAVDRVVDRFVASGLMKREYEHVKLHCTLLNSLFRREAEGGAPAGARETLDARPLLQAWPDLTLGQVVVAEVHLSLRRAGKRTVKGYYLPSHVVKLGDVPCPP